MSTASLATAGVLVAAVGGFFVATLYDDENRVYRITGVAGGLALLACGLGLVILGLFNGF